MKPPRSAPPALPRGMRQLSHWGPEFDLIARFGGAQLVKDLAGRLSIRGGTPEDQAAARAWAAQFLDAPLHEPPSLRYTIMPRPERSPRGMVNPIPPGPPPPRPELTPEERLRQYLANNPSLKAAPPLPTSEDQA